MRVQKVVKSEGRLKAPRPVATSTLARRVLRKKVEAAQKRANEEIRRLLFGHFLNIL